MTVWQTDRSKYNNYILSMPQIAKAKHRVCLKKRLSNTGIVLDWTA